MATTNPIAQLNLSDDVPIPSSAGAASDTQGIQPNRFVAAVSRLGSIAGSVLLPGFGGVAGTMLGGIASNLANDPAQYLMLQERVQAQARAYEAATAVLKAKHDAAMDCLRNISH